MRSPFCRHSRSKASIASVSPFLMFRGMLTPQIASQE